MLTIIVMVTSFIGVAALVGGVALLFRGDASRDIEDRLDVFASNKGVPRRGAASVNEPNLLSAPLDETKGRLEEILSRVGNSRKLLEQADVAMDPSKFILMLVGLASFGAAICIVLPQVASFWAVIAAPLLALPPLCWLFWKKRSRLRKFGSQLPEALELISRALRAGHSLASGIHLVADEMADPIRKEFQRCYESQNLGLPLEQTLEDMSDRVPNLDLRFFVTAVILQRQTGGDLAEILDKIGTLIRERFRIWGQIQALTGEGRLSGIVLLAMPPALFVVMYFLNPGYCNTLFLDPLGHKMLAGAVVMQIVGALVIKKIIAIKV
ncbi:MAG: type II secretion system F family protein [Planctomycetota bacterium]